MVAREGEVVRRKLGLRKRGETAGVANFGHGSERAAGGAGGEIDVVGAARLTCALKVVARESVERGVILRVAFDTFFERANRGIGRSSIRFERRGGR
jgi:hypothetical protein